MNVDYQVLTFKNQIKPKDIGGLGVELNDRKGSGNYDKERTQFNIEYVGFDGHPTLSSKVYETIYTNNIHFNKGDNTNILNGCVVTSGPEFFKKLGLPMKDTGRVHIEGKHIGEPIFCPDIKSKEDIPEPVLEYFNESYRFLSNIVGKENVVYAGVHFDEDTPHMHFYFLPVVDHVRRKVFETDESGKRLTKQIYTKNNTIKNVPIQKLNEKGKPIYEVEYGKFLNTDEFWKQLGGKASFARLQDQYNEYITSKGFELDRGEIGANKHHQDKAEHNIKVLEDKIDKLNKELEITKSINEIELKTKDEIKNLDEDTVLNPTKDFLKRYKDKDVEKLIDYSKEIKKENLATKKESDKKSIEIEKLENQIKNLKSGKTLQDKNKIIENQKLIIKEKDETIEYQNNIIESLKQELANVKEMATTLLRNVKEVATDLYKALKRTLGFNVDKNQKYDYSTFKDLSKKVNKKYEQDKSDDFEL
jgi:hypothetical protein